mgnify:FL=1
MSHEQNDQQAQMLRGTAWMTASNFISRLLGAAYIIPWYIWMGNMATSQWSFYNGLQYLCLVSLDFDSRSACSCCQASSQVQYPGPSRS